MSQSTPEPQDQTDPLLTSEMMARAELLSRSVLSLLLREKELETVTAVAALASALGVMIGQTSDSKDGVQLLINLAGNQVMPNAWANFAVKQGLPLDLESYGFSSDARMSVGTVGELYGEPLERDKMH